MNRYFSFEVEVMDDKNFRRRLLYAALSKMEFGYTLFHAIQSKARVKPYICTMPLKLADGWNLIQINLEELTRKAYGNSYVETLRVQMHANCRLRRISFAERLYSEDDLPPEFKLFLPASTGAASSDSIHNALERPVVYRALQSLQKKLGAERFPLVPMSYYSHHSAMRFTPEFPLVAKVGSAEAGYGKMRFLKQEDLEDFRSVLALHNDYVTLERFVEDRLYDIRVQKIGDHYRAYKRENANWKGNVGTCLLEEIEVTEKFREWAEECGKLFGGMDILTVDAIHTADGKDWILEINDTASGFAPCSLEEDMAVTRQLVLQRLQEAYDSS
ncbi:Asparaginyl-tRNA synthetase, cytoplasmic (Asparagine--tRNA ligase) (AsnRS) [Balamuthia mandrillaris]